MGSLYRFECWKYAKSVGLVSIITALMIVFSMSFYPAISDYMATLSTFFETGAMQQVFKIFNLNVGAMTSLIGFYTTYCTMWVTLIGSVIFGFYGAKAIAAEQIEGTYEFVLSLPVSRRKLWLIKWSALMTALSFYAVVVGGSGLIALAIYGSESNAVLQQDALTPALKASIIAEQAAIVPMMALTEDDFQTFTQGLIMAQFNTSGAELDEAGIDVNRILSLIGDDLEDPLMLFDKMLANPEPYFEAFQLENVSLDEFVEGIQSEKASYLTMHDAFFDPAQSLSSFFEMSPEFFLNLMLSKGIVGDVDYLLSGKVTAAKLFAPYSVKDFLKRHGLMILTVWLNATLGFLLATLVKWRDSAMHLAVGGVFVMYFLNNVSQMMPSTNWIKWLSTFGYFDLEKPASGGVSAILCMGLIALSMLAIRQFERADLVR
ncbi:ABC transporter permease subunit [Fusibacter paucivorans]|uniref:ABC transporter permease subunit n=1 Tax=Fusibacter paucivorans TaxID=76009 RepID=A0ABS5PMM0_9FIRM|nr:ABC transporter permease subunit [Fusibacter paucivorans]MBS7526435.1 ABC transporter permease subunit [Fusibacter paucivorans]